ncbi:MAG: inositol monophosphatase family protein [Verrucomicrobiota bacterium]
MKDADAWNPFLEFAREVAWEAGRITLAHFQSGVTAEYKEDDTPVTVADRKAEEWIRGRIERAFPEHGILGEEYGEVNEGASHRWIIDPIDGTKSFLTGVPLYSVLVALEVEGIGRVGVANFPALAEMVSAAEGAGCYWNSRRCQVSSQTDLSRAFLAHADASSYEAQGKQAAWERLQEATYYRAGWCDAYGYALVATGRVEIMVDPILSLWDCAPLGPILSEAGGYFGDWSGKESSQVAEGLGTSRALLPEVLRVIEGA